MSTTGYVHYGNLKTFVEKAVKPVCRKLFIKRYNELKPDDCEQSTWTVDFFLQIKKDVILSHRVGRQSEWILFPDGNKKSYFEKWDPTLICFLLVEVCNLGSKVLTSNLKMLIEYLDNIEKVETDQFDQSKYESYLVELKSIIKLFLDEIKDKELTRKINDVCDNIEREKLIKKQNASQSKGKQIVVMKSVGNKDPDTERLNGDELDKYNDGLSALAKRLHLANQPTEKSSDKKDGHVEKTEIIKSTEQEDQIKVCTREHDNELKQHEELKLRQKHEDLRTEDSTVLQKL